MSLGVGSSALLGLSLALLWTTPTNLLLSTVNRSQSMFPVCGIPDPSLFGSTDVIPGMKDIRLVSSATVRQMP